MSSPNTHMPVTAEEIDEYLFRGGMTLEQYFIRRAPASECLCYLNPEGREFYLHVGDDALADRLRNRLIALGVRIVQVGKS